MKRKQYRIIMWGPGEVGGSVTRAMLQRPEFKIVGAKVFSPHKDGKDLGELVGVEPIGLTATASKEDILNLDADCVVVTPTGTAIYEGLDQDVIEILESGKNVISTAAYHNTTMQNWVSGSRPTASRLADACHKGRVSLHGAGVHPSFITERIAVPLAGSLEKVEHMRIVEAGDFSLAPAEMWGGLASLGFGSPTSELNSESLMARGGDLYYGDMTGNVAHSLYGVSNSEVRVEREFRGIPATEDFQVGNTTIEKGTAAALHMTHRGYIGDHHFFTNEECFYLGQENAYRGDDLPFGGSKAASSYTIEIEGKPGSIRTQLDYEWQEGLENPVTHASTQAVLAAIGPICDAEPGIFIDDTSPHYRLDDRAGES